MIRRVTMRVPMIGILAASMLACASTEGGRTSAGTAASAPPVAPDCRVVRASGDVAVLRRASDELVVVGGGVELLRSADLGQSWRREGLPVTCRWPGVAEVNGRLLVSCSEARPPGRLLVLAEDRDGSWGPPIAVDTAAELLIDTTLQRISDSQIVLFATHVDRREDLDDSVYTIRAYRSADGGSTWSTWVPVVSGRRGEHLEDSRSQLLGTGELLLAWERETVEGGGSELVQLRSLDSGRSWERPEVIWRGGDVEPGGYLQFADGELWFIASSDELAGGGSYDTASILARGSWDGGRTWSPPQVLVDRENQLSFGGVVLPGDEVLLASLRFYRDRHRRQLSLYLVDRDGSGPARCAIANLSQDGFERGFSALRPTPP